MCVHMTSCHKRDIKSPGRVDASKLHFSSVQFSSIQFSSVVLYCILLLSDDDHLQRAEGFVVFKERSFGKKEKGGGDVLGEEGGGGGGGFGV